MVCLKRIPRVAFFGVLCVFVHSFLLPPLFAETQISGENWTLLWGTDNGLFARDQSGSVETLWSGGKVEKIVQRGSGASAGWAILTDRGILISRDLVNWEERNNGLPEQVIKLYDGQNKSLLSFVQDISDLKVDPENPEVMVCTFKNAVYLSRNGGGSWESLGMPEYQNNGIKAAAVFSLPGEGLTVLCSHSIYGIHYIHPGRQGAKWIEMNTGIEKLETTSNPDEISDFAVVPGTNTGPTVYTSQTFRRRIYSLDWAQKKWNILWADSSVFGSVDSLSPGENSLRFVRDGGIMELQLFSSSVNIQPVRRQDLMNELRTITENELLNCAVIRASPETREAISLSELWLLNEFQPGTNSQAAAGREGLYLPVNHAMDAASLKPYLDIIESRGLNMVVIDMKDDYGRLRFTPRNSSLTNFGRVFWPVDIDAFLKNMKDRGIYTVARVVVFKDPEAAARQNARYAVWDGPNNAPWQGYYDTRRRKGGGNAQTNSALRTEILPDRDPDYEIVRTWYDEKWVDPYSEEIWEYNAAVAEELYRRGFDEIQFDYIRFPTDGINLANARYRWQDRGMDMDSAIVSFLRHVRSRVNAPISVDIYGANGWYRSGARTGQKVELIAPWVDIICPMYYPSHFEQYFLAQDPPELRPYRIYYQGTLRTHYIAKGRVIVRPWAQAFYLNVSYDRQYYNSNYVRLQAEAVRAAGNGGLTYWNNSGRYGDIPE